MFTVTFYRDFFGFTGLDPEPLHCSPGEFLGHCIAGWEVRPPPSIPEGGCQPESAVAAADSAEQIQPAAVVYGELVCSPPAAERALGARR